MALIYTTIQHQFRKKHELTINQYCLIDMIYHLSVNPDSDVGGWCYMSKVNMGNELDLTKRTILNLITKMIERGFIEKHPVTKHLRTTKKWNVVYFTCGEKSSPQVKNVPLNGEKSSPDGGEKSSPNNNNIYNNINNLLMSEIKISDVPQDLKSYFEIAFSFRELFIKNLTDRNSPAAAQNSAKFKNYVDPIRLMMENDGVTREHLLTAHKFIKSSRGEFWHTNILSTKKLRVHITQIVAQAAILPKKPNTDVEVKTWMETQKEEFEKGLKNISENDK